MNLDSPFTDLLDKYKDFLVTPTDEKELLRVGKRLFGELSTGQTCRPSYDLLKAKEDELSTKKQEKEVKIKSLAKAQHVRTEQPTQMSPEQYPEEIMVLQDKNGMLLARRKALEKQRDHMNNQYGCLMETSVQQKVHLKLQMQKLKAELQEALSCSRPNFMQGKQTNTRPIMDELQELNQLVLSRISSFKMSINQDAITCEREVLDRYKPHMERLLGQIYSHSEYLPSSEVNEKFNEASFNIEHEIRDIETELKSEHERNDQLQKEAKQLGDKVAEQQEEVNRLKKQNSVLAKEISFLKDVAASEIASMRESYKSLLEDTGDDHSATPGSARAMVCTTGNERRVIMRSPSQKLKMQRSSAIPTIFPLSAYTDQMKAVLLDKINQSQMV